MVSISGMTVSLKTDLRFPITGQQEHGSRNIHRLKQLGYIPQEVQMSSDVLNMIASQLCV